MHIPAQNLPGIISLRINKGEIDPERGNWNDKTLQNS